MKPFKNLTSYEGQYGIEVEIEAYNLRWDDSGLPWRGTRDGSLRGESCEFVLVQPLNLKEALESLDTLYNHVILADKIYESGRAGVHVHVNIKDWDWKRFQRFVKMYYAVEEPLIASCGEERVGNHYCVSAKYGSGILEWASHILNSGGMEGFREMEENSHKYSSLNFFSVIRHGSLELRCMRSTSSPEPIKKFLGRVALLVEKSSLEEDVKLTEEYVKNLLVDLKLPYTREDVLQGYKNLCELDLYSKGGIYGKVSVLQ